jgi:hypothetical protein
VNPALRTCSLPYAITMNKGVPTLRLDIWWRCLLSCDFAGRGKSFGLGPAILAKLTLSQCDLRRNRNSISTTTITMNKGVPTLRLDMDQSFALSA